MPSMSGKAKHEVITSEDEDDQMCADRCSPPALNNKETIIMQRNGCSPRRLKNLALSDMLSEFHDEGISSPPADLAATFNSTEEPPMLYSGECMEMNNDILDLTKPLPWDTTGGGLKKGNSSISLDSLNDNYLESNSQDGTVDLEKVKTNKDGEECSCGENVSPACPVHREKALLTEEIQRTCSSLVESLNLETPNDDNDDDPSDPSTSLSPKRKKQKYKKRDALEDLYSSLESRDFEAYLRTRTSLRTLNMLASCNDQDSCSTESSSTRPYREDSQDGSSRASSTNSSSFSVPSVHKSDLSSSPESYDLLYKSFEAAGMMGNDEGGDSEVDKDESPILTPLEMFNKASPKLQKALSARQQRALETVHSDNEQNEAKESSGMYDSRLCKSLPIKPSNGEGVDSNKEQKVTTFAQLAKTRKKPDTIIQAPQTLTIKPTHWSELANQDKKSAERSDSADDRSTPDANTPKRPHSLPIQLRFITKPASRPTQTPDQSQPVIGGLIRGVTRTISAPEGFGADGMPIESQQHEMTRTTLEKLNALEAPTSTPPARYAPPFADFISSTDSFQSLPPNLQRYHHWLNNSDVQSQLSQDSSQPFRERLSSEPAADMHKVFSGNQSYMQERPHSLVLASYCDDGMEALPPQEIPVSPRYVGHHDTVDMLRKRALVAAIDGAVDHILGHFAQAINKSPLEKVRLGDSQQTPNIGHIVLHYLCPAICDLLLDGLKPHMQSFIVGRVKTTVWTPVEATTRLGPGTRSLYELVTTLSKLRYLRESSMKTNAFIFGLLNTRNMEIWLEHIRSHPDIIRTLYEPEAFLSLCNTSTRQLFDKLLLALQPLAILPFNLDYQFEHKYMQQHASIRREKQQLQEQHTKLGSLPRQGSLPDPRQSPGGRSSGRFSSLLGRGPGKDLNRSNSWASSLSSSFGFGKTFAGQSSGRGQTPSSEQSESDRLLRTGNTSPSKNTNEDKVGGSADTTPTNSTQSWSLDWIKSFVAASDQPEGIKTVDSTTISSGVAAPAQQPANAGSSWSRFGASMFRSFGRKRQTEPQQQPQQQQQPELVQIEERPSTPPGSPSKQITSDIWNKASPGSPMKALCHHVTMSPGELSFSKGDILTVDHQVDPDWLLCHHGRESGLVHIDYVQGF